MRGYRLYSPLKGHWILPETPLKFLQIAVKLYEGHQNFFETTWKGLKSSWSLAASLIIFNKCPKSALKPIKTIWEPLKTSLYQNKGFFILYFLRYFNLSFLYSHFVFSTILLSYSCFSKLFFYLLHLCYFSYIYFKLAVHVIFSLYFILIFLLIALTFRDIYFFILTFWIVPVFFPICSALKFFFRLNLFMFMSFLVSWCCRYISPNQYFFLSRFYLISFYRLHLFFTWLFTESFAYSLFSCFLYYFFMVL